MSGLWQINKWTLAQCPSLSGKTAVVTGGARSIGAQITAQLLVHGISHVVVLSKHPESYENAKKNEWKGLDTSKVDFHQMDLANLSDVKKTADYLAQTLPKLDMLFLNAGIPTVYDYQLSPDGIEEVFAANHLGHFVLTNTLLPLLERTAKTTMDSRIVVTSSSLHMAAASGLRFETLESPHRVYCQPFDSVYRYARSKLANILFTRKLTRILAERGVRGVYVNSFFPGNVPTSAMDTWKDVFGPVGYLLKGFFRVFGQSTRDGATTALFLGASDEVKKRDLRGKYFIPVAYEYNVSKLARDEDLADRLWVWSEIKCKAILGTGN